ncbi:MAG: putative bifunctional diguanylate cyclase/phosphodiesterase [Actinomycetes bacterium]
MLGSSPQLSAAVVALLDDGVWVLDPVTSAVLDANEAAGEQLGIGAEWLIGQKFCELSTPHMTVTEWASVVRTVDRLGVHSTTLSLVGPDGTVLPAELTVSRHRTDDVDVIVVRSADASERLWLHAAAQADRDRLDATVASLGEAVAVADRTGRICTVNELFCDTIGLPADRIVDRSLFDPPWTMHDLDGVLIPVEDTPGVHSLRSGEAVRDVPIAIDRPTDGGRRTERRWLRATALPRSGATGLDGTVLTLTDLTEAHRNEVYLERLATTDALTGLATRPRIAEIVEAATGLGNGTRVGVLHVDIDNFRTINDTFGPVTGDRVLSEVTSRLRDLEERRLDMGRIGVDEFLVVLVGDGPSLSFDARLRRLGEEIQRRFERSVSIDDLELHLTASVGIARSPSDAVDGVGLMRSADRALAAGRRAGRHQLRFYEASIDERSKDHLSLDRDLRMAVAQRDLEVHYQPIIDLNTGAVAAAEALVRWTHPERGPVPPSMFIPAAEATGAIAAIGDLVLQTVAEDLAGWNSVSLFPHGARVAVNISTSEFEQRGFVDRIAHTLSNFDVPPAQIELEITETLLMEDLTTSARRLEALDELGFLVALDDFGTGYSSLSYLHTLPLHTLKIDRRFVGDLRDGRSSTITRAILSLAHNLGIVAVAEGVETEEQRRFLAEAGCDQVQGFLIAPPLPKPAFERFLEERRPLVSVAAGSELRLA